MKIKLYHHIILISGLFVSPYGNTDTPAVTQQSSPSSSLFDARATRTLPTPVKQDVTDTQKSEAALQKLLFQYTHIYNRAGYADFLSQDPHDVIMLLKRINHSHLEPNDKIIYTCTVLKLINDKIKACELVDDTVVLELLETLPLFISEYLSYEFRPTIEDMTQQIDLKLNALLLNKFDDFIVDPGHVLFNAAHKIARKYDKLFDRYELQTKLRNLVVRLFDALIQKVMWGRSSFEGTWYSFSTLGERITKLESASIIDDDDDRDSLHWSLVHRFCFFLDLTGSAYPAEFYQEIEDDLKNGAVPFLTLPEQDDGINTKKEVIAAATLRAKAKALAHERHGIISEHITT